MLSALSSTQTMYNAPSCSYGPSPHLPGPYHHTPPMMNGKSLYSSVPHSAASMKSHPVIASPGQMLHVYGYGPQEGVAGTSVVVNVQLNLVTPETTFLRLVVGNRALSTAVRPWHKDSNQWELESVLPEFENISQDVSGASPTVMLTVQALNRSNVTLDSVTFGSFTYIRRRAAPSPLMLCKEESVDDGTFGQSSIPGTPDVKPAVGVPYPLHSHGSRKASRPMPASGTARARAINATMSAKDAQTARGQLKKQSLIRTRRSSSEDDDVDNNYRAVLQIETPIDSMANTLDWDGDEHRVGRRLVRFTREQEGCTLHVACKAIRPSEYTDGDTVVSCIYRPPDAAGSVDPPVSQCCITSVDIIFLLECLVGDVFNIEEKNRIRRNLEGFRPKTVSKNKAGTEEFFQKIMDFPAPKPRNIEKDVKVFDWAVLPQALDKIISKYTLYPIAKKQEDAPTPPISGFTSSPPQSSIASSYSASPSPALGRPSTASSQYPYMYHQPSYSSPLYVPGKLDALEGGYVTATGLSAANAYESFPPHSRPPSQPHSHSHSHPHPHPRSHPATRSPTPLLPTPGGSPIHSRSASLTYVEPSQPLYHPPYADQNAYGPENVYAPSYDHSVYQR